MGKRIFLWLPHLLAGLVLSGCGPADTSQRPRLSREVTDFLIRGLRDPAPMERVKAVNGFWRFGVPSAAVPHLIRVLRDGDWRLRCAARRPWGVFSPGASCRACPEGRPARKRRSPLACWGRSAARHSCGRLSPR